MEKLLKEYLFVFLTLIFFLGINFGVLVQGLKGEIKSLEQIYFSLGIILVLVLLALVIGVFSFFTILLFSLQQKNLLFGLPPQEITKLGNQESEKLIQRLRDQREEIQEMISLLRKNFTNESWMNHLFEN